MQLDKLLEHIDVVVTYVPVRSEVDFNSILHTLKGKERYEIRPNSALDPFVEAKHALSLADGRNAAVLVPGKRFDATGTRHGKGAGWYDRFLSAVPSSWIRIGFCTHEEFSSEPLIREPWDEPMDYLVVVAPQGSSSFYTTHARPGML